MLIGKTLKGRYHVYDRLAEGGAAAVYLCRDTATGKMAVTKIVHDHLVDERFIARFQREIDLLQQLDSPHVMKLYDWSLREFDPHAGRIMSYIIAEFVEGHTLADIIDTRGALPEENALFIARQVALGLEHIHRKGIVHRDIKAQNVMVTPDDHVKIIDFGIAKGDEHPALTFKANFAGTLYYAAPEQILESRSVDARADIYSLGVILYEMLMASLPVSDRDMAKVASRVVAGDLDNITGVSEATAHLVNDMLSLRPENRPQTAIEVVRRIDSLLDPSRVTHMPQHESSADTRLRLPHRSPQAEAPQASLSYILSMDDGLTFSLPRAETVIGRSHPRHSDRPDVDLVVLDLEKARTVSRRHCRLTIKGDTFVVEDLGSMNGTFVNGTRLEQFIPCDIQLGDMLMVGRVKLVFMLSSQ